MTKERFKEMLRALLDGDVIELKSCVNQTDWIPVVIDDDRGQFNICVDNHWHASPIGGPGDIEWRRIGLHETGPKTA